ncbi:tyrosine-type recombinase/integrase [Micromonospora sp. C28SCA-DRY-2]|uniref:tyrosine-type recombinase/integrase n=1 Tax=Micromonospora sp. C28SCA-DRY-2 TaxID=3059522 RepID=UPI0026756444|nr:tyrosine-type recombinase/integrase [Micromonospora sp. C28SCA-DRY-2]MDO3704066.1 tyrosine-type recombinase/integrase [Micromonospora sp. C28SCA-DRY-2]
MAWINALISVTQQMATHGYTPVIKKVKSESGNRVVSLDSFTQAALRAHHTRRAQWKLACGNAWPHIGLFFVQPDGQPWHPQTVTDRFEALVRDSGLPPIRLHDLRHCAATYLKTAGADLKDIQELLGHSSITMTDTYTSVIAELDVERAKPKPPPKSSPADADARHKRHRRHHPPWRCARGPHDTGPRPTSGGAPRRLPSSPELGARRVLAD